MTARGISRTAPDPAPLRSEPPVQRAARESRLEVSLEVSEVSEVSDAEPRLEVSEVSEVSDAEPRLEGSQVEPPTVVEGPPSVSGRRRGSVLIDAIHGAVLDLVVEQGVCGVTMEAVAARAGTSKPVLYRRWPERTALLRHTLLAALLEPGPDVDTGSVRADLLELLRGWAALFDGRLGSAIGAAVIGAVPHDPELAMAFRDEVVDRRREQVALALSRGIERGEVRADVSGVVAELGPAVLWHRFLVTAEPITDRFLHRLVDEILLPLITTGQGRGGT